MSRTHTSANSAGTFARIHSYKQLLNEVTAPTSHFVNASIVSRTQSARLPDASPHFFDNLRLFYNQRERSRFAGPSLGCSTYSTTNHQAKAVLLPAPLSYSLFKMSAMIIILGMALPILIVGLFAYLVYLTKGVEREHR